MKYSNPLFALPLLLPLISGYHRQRCAFGDSCWPSPEQWASFNSSISGRLIISLPSAAVCHREHYDAQLCQTATSNWTNSFWRTSQPGAYAAIVWELGQDQCFINTTIDAPCGPGLVAHYSVAAQDVTDIQAAVKFADHKDLYLVIKNTGHDHLGRSSGKGAFSIWTHNLKGREWHNAFVPKGSPNGRTGIPAVTLQAGEQWLDVYRDAAEHNVTVVGGQARTVGAAGGWATGGGHSPLAHFYGLGVDNILEVNLVTPLGEYKTLNKYNDPQYFYAVRGGGGSAWGVITSITYKTHPNPSHVQVGFAQFTTTSNSSFRTVLSHAFKALPRITDAGYTGYGAGDSGYLGLIFIQPNGTDETFRSAFAPLYEIANMTNVTGQIGSFDFPTWMDYLNTFLQDPNIATNVMDTSRLLTANVLLNQTEELLDLVQDYPEMGLGFNFIGKVNSAERDNTAVHDIWKHSRALFTMSVDWRDDAPEAEKKRLKLQAVEVSGRFAEIVGPDGGTYINEANP